MEEHQPNIKELLSHVNKLKALLEDPHPGLFTWCQAYALEMAAISFWGEVESDDEDG